MHLLWHQHSLRNFLALVFFVLIVHAPVLSTDWPTWDSWIYDRSANLNQPDIVLTWLHAEARYIEARLFSINLHFFSSSYVLAYKIQLACSLIVSAIFIGRFLVRNFMVSPKVAVISTAIAFVQPHLATLMSHNIAGQHVINSCLWIGLYLHQTQTNKFRRAIGIALVCVSFDVNANLSLLLGLIAVENIHQVRRLHSFSSQLAWNHWLRHLRKNWASGYRGITLCPFIYYFARTFLWGPHGFAQDYNKLILFEEPRRFLRSCAKSIFDIASNGWGSKGVQFTALLGLALLSGLIFHVHRNHRFKEQNTRKISPLDASRLLQICILWAAVIIPYAAVGKSSYTGPSFQWEARHGLLYTGPLAASMAIIISMASRWARTRYRRTLHMAFLLCGMPAFLALENRYFNFRYTALIEKSLVRVLQQTPPPLTNRLLIVDTSRFLPLRPEYRFFELSGLLGRSFGNEIPLVCPRSATCRPFLRSVIRDPEHSKAFGLRDRSSSTQFKPFDQPPVRWDIRFDAHSKRRHHAFFDYLDLWINNDSESSLSNLIRIHRVDPLVVCPQTFKSIPAF